MGDGSCLAALTLEQELRYAIQGRVGNALEYQIKNLTCEHPDAIKVLSAALRFLAIYGFS